MEVDEKKGKEGKKKDDLGLDLDLDLQLSGRKIDR